MRSCLAVFALLVVFGFPGCDEDKGDEDGSGGSGGTFVERADVVCSDAELEISRIARPQNSGDPLQVALFLERALPIARRQNQRLRRLERPEEQRVQIDQLLAALEAEVAAGEQMLAAARRENRAGVQAALQQSQLATLGSRQAAQELGLVVCGGGN
jgi:hypothetical protein